MRDLVCTAKLQMLVSWRGYQALMAKGSSYITSDGQRGLAFANPGRGRREKKEGSVK